MEQRVEPAGRRALVSRARELRRARALRTAAAGQQEPLVEGDAAARVTVIEAAAPRTRVELAELWRARELAFAFAWRDVKVRYKQSFVGIGWAILQPLLTMVVFTIIFGKFAKLPSEGKPYQPFVYAGLLPWTFFSTALSQISTSVMSNRALVQKVYFPRLILPISGLLVPGVDFLCSVAVLIGIMAWYHTGVSATVLLAPVFLLLLAITALGVGSVLATINARYRDVPYAIPFLVQIWLYLSPVIYAANALPAKWHAIVSFNPAVAGITGFRWAVLGTHFPSTFELAAGLPVAVGLLILGFRVYRSWESRFVDTL
ncbi:MAG TPA: ABC transporter permease [Gaiellaceae bacterium]|nr:ABC transporter permease [Gaiellaceae bacterium]